MNPENKFRLEHALLELYAQFAPDLRRGELVDVATREGRLTLALTVTVTQVWLNQCEDDVLAVLRKTQRQMTAKEIDAALKKMGKHWGTSTLANSLANLVANGWLRNRRDGRGYILTQQESPSCKSEK